jgi:hypothetical protein
MLILRAAIEGLLKLGILQGDKEDILKTRTSVAFFPHGLGHYLGMDTVRLFSYLRNYLPNLLSSTIPADIPTTKTKIPCLGI